MGTRSVFFGNGLAVQYYPKLTRIDRGANPCYDSADGVSLQATRAAEQSNARGLNMRWVLFSVYVWQETTVARFDLLFWAKELSLPFCCSLVWLEAIFALPTQPSELSGSRDNSLTWSTDRFTAWSQYTNNSTLWIDFCWIENSFVVWYTFPWYVYELLLGKSQVYTPIGGETPHLAWGETWFLFIKGLCSIRRKTCAKQIPECGNAPLSSFCCNHFV